jgi:hypothetical protein
MSENNQQQQQPTLIGGHAQYVKGATEVGDTFFTFPNPFPRELGLVMLTLIAGRHRRRDRFARMEILR